MFEIDENVDKCFYYIGLIVIAVALIFAGLGFTVLKDFMDKIPHCLFHATTGYYCPGCGGKRAVRLMLMGHFVKSFYYHPFVVFGVGLGGWFMVSQTIERISRGRLKIGLHFRGIYMWMAIGLIILNCLVKNMALMFWGIKMMS